MNRAAALIFLLIPLFTNAQLSSSKKSLLLMGSNFELVAIHPNTTARTAAIESAIHEIRRIESLISSWNPDSETSLINRNAGIRPVEISEELFSLIVRCIKVSELTDGAFDISFSSLDPIWKFDGRSMQFPDSSLVKESVQKINYKNIFLDHAKGTVYLLNKGMKIGFGAIGKGYAANRAKKVMKDHGIVHGMVNAGGDLITWGTMEDGAKWQVGIADPAKEKDYIAWLTVRDFSVVTSGNYEKFVVIEGQKYGHIINPKTGWPVTGIQSVTLVSPDAELSDALATSVFVLGVTAGLDLINRLKNVECLIIDDYNKIWTSDRLELNYY